MKTNCNKANVASILAFSSECTCAQYKFMVRCTNEKIVFKTSLLLTNLLTLGLDLNSHCIHVFLLNKRDKTTLNVRGRPLKSNLFGLIL